MRATRPKPRPCVLDRPGEGDLVRTGRVARRNADSWPASRRTWRMGAPAIVSPSPTWTVSATASSLPSPSQTKSTRSGFGTSPETASGRLHANQLRRYSPSLNTSSPTSRWRSSARRIAASSAASSSDAVASPASWAARASSRSPGRRRLPTCSARRVIQSRPPARACTRATTAQSLSPSPCATAPSSRSRQAFALGRGRLTRFAAARMRFASLRPRSVEKPT